MTSRSHHSTSWEDFAMKRGSGVARSSNAALVIKVVNGGAKLLQNDVTVSGGDVTLDSDEVTVTVGMVLMC